MVSTLNSITLYDIIGDIHGHYSNLVSLLDKLGYTQNDGNWQHTEKRKVIFVGDYIDRGPKILEVVRLVRSMVEAGSAIALMGNHEFNAIAYNTKDNKGKYCREHNPKNKNQHQESIDQALNHKVEWKSHLDWFLTLPLFFEDKNIRAVHACWDNKTIDRLKELLKGNSFSSNQDIINASAKGSELYNLIEITLKGRELKLPSGIFLTDKEGHKRSEVRIKWWKDPSNISWKEYSMNFIPELSGNPPKTNYGFYGLKEKPVFFGHYWRSGIPELMHPNVCCLDYSVAKGGNLAAYQKNGELALIPDNFEVA